jgi:uncharacterized protein YbaP (TraB family)
MAFRFVLLFVFCFTAGWQTVRAESASSDPADIRAQIDSAPARGLFYEIRKDGKTAFLFGTLHVGTPDFFPLERRATGALIRSTGLVVEIDITQADALLAAMQRHALLPDGERLDALLTPALRTRLQTQLDALALSRETVQAFKPWMAALTLTMGGIRQSGFDGGYATDGFLIGLAKGLDKPVAELEGADEQLGLFDSMPRADQIAFLDEVLQSMENGKLATDTRALVSAWLAGDADALGRLAGESLDENPRSGPWMQQKLFTERNYRMAERIERLLADGQSPFVAVGALHFVGPDGLPALLAERGYRVVDLYPQPLQTTKETR